METFRKDPIKAIDRGPKEIEQKKTNDLTMTPNNNCRQDSGANTVKVSNSGNHDWCHLLIILESENHIEVVMTNNICISRVINNCLDTMRIPH